jgi:adenylosuccinate synthase
LPPIISSTDDLKTEYIELDGWNESTRGCRNFNELPKNAKKYIETLREITGVEVSLLSTSPEREDTILFKNPF